MSGRYVGNMAMWFGVLWVCRWCVPASISCRVIVVHRLSVLWVFGGVSSRVDVVRFIGRVLWVFGGAFLLLFLAGGQWFIGSVVYGCSVVFPVG